MRGTIIQIDLDFDIQNMLCGLVLSGSLQEQVGHLLKFTWEEDPMGASPMPSNTRGENKFLAMCCSIRVPNWHQCPYPK